MADFPPVHSWPSPTAFSKKKYGSANNLNQYPSVQGVAQGYDDNGNLTAGVLTATFDVLNSMTQPTLGGTTAAGLISGGLMTNNKPVGINVVNSPPQDSKGGYHTSTDAQLPSLMNGPATIRVDRSTPTARAAVAGAQSTNAGIQQSAHSDVPVLPGENAIIQNAGSNLLQRSLNEAAKHSNVIPPGVVEHLLDESKSIGPTWGDPSP